MRENIRFSLSFLWLCNNLPLWIIVMRFFSGWEGSPKRAKWREDERREEEEERQVWVVTWGIRAKRCTSHFVETPQQQQQKAIYSPCLLIKGKIRDVDGARALIDCRWNPQDFTVGINQHVWLVSNLIVTIGVVEQDNIRLIHIHTWDGGEGECEGGKDCKMMR